jgi:hypothetical protein
VAALAASWALVAGAVDIRPQFDSNVSAAQKAVINKKIELWEKRLPHQNPEHVVTVDFRNADLGSLFLGALPGVEPVRTDSGALTLGEETTLAQADNFEEDSDGRPTKGRITINSNSAVTWHNGLTEPVPAGRHDLWTVVNHELMHVLGFTVQNSRFRRNVTNLPGGKRKYTGSGGSPTGTLTPSGEGTHLDPGSHSGDLMNPGIPAGKRIKPSPLDIGILKDDVWKYPQIQGKLSNFDVWNRSGSIANDFQVKLEGVKIADITDVYNGSLHPFSDGVKTQEGDTAVVKWGPGPGQVGPGSKAHFGFKLTGDKTPKSKKFEWTFNSTVISEITVSGTEWRMLTGGGIQNRVSNRSESARFVMRRVNTSLTPIVLDDLVAGSPLDATAVLIDPEPVFLEPDESVTHEFPFDPSAWGVVMIADLFEDGGGAPGEAIGTWFDAAQNVQGRPSGLVPDQPGWPGPPLRVLPAGPDELLLEWEPSCVPEDLDYEIYEGALGDYTSHVARTCSTGGMTSWTFLPEPGSRYFLVVPGNFEMEGSYGRDSLDEERPQGSAVCLTQWVGSCP